MTGVSSAADGAAQPALTTSLVTCSFRGDFDVCRLLCESIDRFVPESIEHIIYVPAKDMHLFGEFASARRRIVAEETLLPRWFWKLPMPPPRWRALLRLPRRNIYLTPFSPPVRGWIVQQMMKIAATAAAKTDIVAHVDSDNALVRPLTLDLFVRDGKVRLYRDPEKVELNSHRLWHAAAGRLLGLPPSDFYDAEYIDSFVVWRRSVLLGLIARLESVAGRDWRVALARTPHFAEYILYGAYADKALGLDAAGLFAATQSLCHSRWLGRFDDADQERSFVEALRPEHVSCLIQSTIPMSLEARRQIFERVTAFAAEQDRDGGGAR
jgi:hypothetical protein